MFLLLLRFFLFFLTSAEFAAGPLAMAVLTAVEAFSLGVAHRDRASSCGGGASGMVVSLGAVLALGWATVGYNLHRLVGSSSA